MPNSNSQIGWRVSYSLDNRCKDCPFADKNSETCGNLHPFSIYSVPPAWLRDSSIEERTCFYGLQINAVIAPL